MSSFCFFFLFLLTLSSTSSRSRSRLRLWQRCHLTTVVVVLGLAFPSTVAGSTQNVSMTELVISPASDWSIVDGDILATNTPGASVTYVCRQPCTGISFILIQPASEKGQITACLDCVNAPSNAQSNSTNFVLVNTQSLISYQNLQPELHSLEITTHSTTNVFVGTVEVSLPSDGDSSPPPSSSDSSDTSSVSNPQSTSTSDINTASAERQSTSTSSSSTSTSTDGSNSEKLASSSSSSKTSITAIAAGVAGVVLALLAGILICLYRRRKQRRSRPGAGAYGAVGNGNRRSRWQKIISGGGGGGDGLSSDEEGLQKRVGRPPSPMLETFRSSRDLEAEYGYGFIPTESKNLDGGGFGGVSRSAVPFASIPGDAGRASIDDARSSDDMDRGSYNINNNSMPPTLAPVKGLSPIAEDEFEPRPQINKSLSRRTSIPSIYSAYSDPWQTVDDDYYYNSDAEDDPTGAKAERLKANLKLSANAGGGGGGGGGRKNTTATTRTRRDTTVSVKNMLNDLNDAIRTGADAFAWKKSTMPSDASSSGGGGGGGGGGRPPVPAVPMQFLSPNSAAVGRKQTRGTGHKPSRSTDVLI